MKTNQILIPIMNNRFSKWVLMSFILIIMCLSFSCKDDTYETIEKKPFLQGRGFGLTATTIAVKQMDSARKYYSEKLGFSLGRSKNAEDGYINGTLVSKISLPDMSSIELLATIDSIVVTGKDSIKQQFIKQKEGIRQYTISSSSLDSTYTWLTSEGFKVDSVEKYKSLNKSPNKKPWDDEYSEVLNLGYTNIQKQAYLPQFSKIPTFPYERMTEWNSFYNMQRSFIKHPNGAIGISALKIKTSDIEATRKEFLKMGFKEVKDSLNQNQIKFKIKRNQEIHLVASRQKTNSDSIKLIQPEVFGIVVQVKNILDTKYFLEENLSKAAYHWDSITKQLSIPKAYAYGVDIEFIEEPEEQAFASSQLNLNYGAKLDSVAKGNASKLYQKYCALCHGKDREGYAADNAPSLRSKSLLASSKGNNFIRYTIQYGRGESAMAGYYNRLGGPLSLIEIELLIKWLEEEAGIEKAVEISRDPVIGDVELGKTVYETQCAICHGKEGEGISAPALGNPMLLATATDDFLRYAIKEGRDGTPMLAYKNSLKNDEIDGVTAYLRTRASGWNAPKTDSILEPKPEDYILNPNGAFPNFKLREGRYVSAEQLNKAIQDSMRLVILDARSKVAWRQTHIPGSIPVPYYDEPEAFTKYIPKENTMIVAYCACPHAASGRVINKLKKLGYKNTAILDEGILIWAQQGYPVKNGH